MKEQYKIIDVKNLILLRDFLQEKYNGEINLFNTLHFMDKEEHDKRLNELADSVLHLSVKIGKIEEALLSIEID